MKDLTPKAMRCGPFNCPSIGRLDGGSLLIVGKRASMAAAIERVSVGEDEHAVIISPDLLSDYVAGEVAALKAENERLREALKPFADEFEQRHQHRPIEADAVRVRMTGVGPYFTIGDLRRARAETA